MISVLVAMLVSMSAVEAAAAQTSSCPAHLDSRWPDFQRLDVCGAAEEARRPGCPRCGGEAVAKHGRHRGLALVLRQGGRDLQTVTIVTRGMTFSQEVVGLANYTLAIDREPRGQQCTIADAVAGTTSARDGSKVLLTT